MGNGQPQIFSVVTKLQTRFPFLLDVPSGLQTDPQVTTIVGNDVRLTCRASKYIYSHLAWYHPSAEAARGDSLIRKTDNYSISLTLVIANVTKEQSGLYRCRAQNQHNRTDMLEQHTQLLVRGRSCQWERVVGCSARSAAGGELLHNCCFPQSLSKQKAPRVSQGLSQHRLRALDRVSLACYLPHSMLGADLFGADQREKASPTTLLTAQLYHLRLSPQTYMTLVEDTGHLQLLG